MMKGHNHRSRRTLDDAALAGIRLARAQAAIKRQSEAIERTPEPRRSPAARARLAAMETRLRTMATDPSSALSTAYQPFVSNRLLGAIDDKDFALLAPHLRSEILIEGGQLVRRDEDIEALAFPESGIAMIVGARQGRSLAVGAIGNDGLSGMPVLLGARRTPLDVVVWLPGDAYVISSERLEKAMRESATLRAGLLRYVHDFQVQMADSITSSLSSVEERLARWLLMCHDRSEGDLLPVTHDMLARVLGVRRASITDAIHRLEGLRAIRATRAAIAFRSRAILERIAGRGAGDVA